MAVLSPTTCINTGKIAKSAPALPNLIGYVHFGIGRKIIDTGSSPRGGLFYVGSGKSVTVGNPIPSFTMGAFSAITFRLPVVKGARSVSIQCAHVRVGVEFYPLELRVLPNVEIGLLSGLSAQSIDTTAWQTVGPITFTATNDGGIEYQVIAKVPSPEVVNIDNLAML